MRFHPNELIPWYPFIMEHFWQLSQPGAHFAANFGLGYSLSLLNAAE
jgi:hypothetical protein